MMLAFLAVLARRWRIVMATILVCMAVAGAITSQLSPTYRASAQLFVALDSGANNIELASGASFSSQRVTSYPDLVDSPLVLQPVIDDLGLDVTASQLATQVTAEVLPNTVLIQVYVDDRSSSSAAAITNAVSTNLASVIEELDRTRDDRSSPVRVSVTREAVAPRSPRTPIPVLNLGLGLVVGIAAGLALAGLREAFDTTIRSDDDVTEVTGLPTLAQVPTNLDVAAQPLIKLPSTSPVWSESYRRLRTNLSFVDPDNPPSVVVVTSGVSGDGKSLTAANLAASLAQGGKRTILVEADLRRPGLGKMLGLTSDVGVTTVVSGRTELAEAVQATDDFDVITSGPVPPNPSELLGSQTFAAMVSTLRADYDSVIIDTPPLIAVTDAAVVSSVGDAVVLVVRAKRTKRQDLRRALFGLRAVDANVVGVVINQVALGVVSYYQYDYRSDEERSRSRDRA